MQMILFKVTSFSFLTVYRLLSHAKILFHHYTAKIKKSLTNLKDDSAVISQGFISDAGSPWQYAMLCYDLKCNATLKSATSVCSAARSFMKIKKFAYNLLCPVIPE